MSPQLTRIFETCGGSQAPHGDLSWGSVQSSNNMLASVSYLIAVVRKKKINLPTAQERQVQVSLSVSFPSRYPLSGNR